MSERGASGDPGQSRPGVLFVLPWAPDAAGGVNSVVLNLFDGFARGGGFRPLLLVSAYPQRKMLLRERTGVPPFYEYFLPPPFDSARLASSILSYLVRLPATMLRLIRFIRCHDVIAVNVHYPGLSAFTLLLARFLAFRQFTLVLSFHGTDLPRCKNLIERLIWAFILRRTDSVVACSRALAEDLRTVDSSVVVHVVHNAVDAAACQVKARLFAVPAPLLGRSYVLAVGKFEHKKAHDILIESFERIAAAHPKLHLAIIGATGPTFATCRGRAAASTYNRRIHLYRDLAHGPTLAAIAQAAVLVLPSRREPFGVVILEAAALLTPVIASRVGGIPEIIEDGHSGRLVPVDGVDALAEALRRSLSDPDESRTLAERLQMRVANQFSLSEQVNAYRELFHSGRGRIASSQLNAER